MFRRRVRSALLAAVVGALAIASASAQAANPEAVLVNAIVTSFAAAAPGGAAAAAPAAAAPASEEQEGQGLIPSETASATPPSATNATEAGYRNATQDAGFRNSMIGGGANGTEPLAEAAAGKRSSAAGGSTTAATLRAMIGSAAARAPKPFKGAVAGVVEERSRGFVSGVAAKVAAGPSATDSKHPLSDALRQNPLLGLIAPAADASYAAKQAVVRAVETDALDKLRAFVAASDVAGTYTRDALANYVAMVKALTSAAKTALSGKAGVLDLKVADLRKSAVSLRDAVGAAKGAASEELQRKAADAVVVADALGEAAAGLAGGAAYTAAAGFASVASSGAAAIGVYRAAEASAAAVIKATVAKKAELLGAALDKATAALRMLKAGTGPLLDKKLDAQLGGIAMLRNGLRMAVAAIEAAPVPSDLVASAKRSAASRDKPLLDKATAPAKKARAAVGKVVGAMDGGEQGIEAAGHDALHSVDTALNGALVGLAGRFREFESAFDDVKDKFGAAAAAEPAAAAAAPAAVPAAKAADGPAPAPVVDFAAVLAPEKASP